MAETIGFDCLSRCGLFFCYIFLMGEGRKQAKNRRFVETCRTIFVEIWGRWCKIKTGKASGFKNPDKAKFEINVEKCIFCFFVLVYIKSHKVWMVIILIGCTVSTIGGPIKGIERAAELGYQCTQIYVTSSRTWKIGAICPYDVKGYAQRYQVQLLGHVPLIVNLASGNDEVREKSLRRLSQEIFRAHIYGVDTLVLHPGSTLDGDIDRGLSCIIKAINDVSDMCEKYNIVLALETMSGQGTQLGSSFEELASVIQGVRDNSHLSVCLDTCHLYAAGYQLENRELLYDTLNKFDQLIGIKRIGAFHLNNTKIEQGKKIDRHSSIFDGNISLESFEALVKDERFEKIPMVIEPPAKDITGAKQVHYLQQIAKGKGEK